MCDFQQLFASDDQRMSLDILSGTQGPSHHSNQVSGDFDFLSMGQQSRSEKQSLLQPTAGSSQVSLVEVLESASPSTATEPHQEHRRTKRVANSKKYDDFIVDAETPNKNPKLPRRSHILNRLETNQPKGQYPTKNLLQNFKGAHLDYLEMHFPINMLKKMEALKPLYAKNTMNMKAYEKLYEMPEFQEVFEKMFAERYLYRAMMLSRSEFTSKKNHVIKISVFEDAFNSKQFNSIN